MLFSGVPQRGLGHLPHVAVSRQVLAVSDRQSHVSVHVLAMRSTSAQAAPQVQPDTAHQRHSQLALVVLIVLVLVRVRVHVVSK